MSRAIKYYEPEERRFGIINNLQCMYCGNTTAFYMDMRLRHQIEVQADGLISIELNRKTSERVFESISRNIWSIIDKSKMEGREIIHCANCHDSDSVDFQERLLDWCWQMGCPGCEVCGDYISEEEVVELCSECIREHDGNVSEDDCYSVCPYYDDGLLNVLDHYGITLEKLKADLGY